MIDLIRNNIPVILLLVFVAIGAYSFYSQGEEAAKRESEYHRVVTENTQLTEDLKATRAHAQAVARVDAERVESAERIRTVTKETIREIPTYLPAAAVAASSVNCLLPAGWGLLHDAAATGTPPSDYAATSRADATPVTPQAAAETVIENYGTSIDTADRLTHLQDYVCATVPAASEMCSTTGGTE